MSRRFYLTLCTTTLVVSTSPCLPPARATTPLPILKQLAQSGWTPDAPLEEEVEPLPPARAGGRLVKCFQIRFTSHSWHGRPVRIFGFYAAPASRGRVPALLLVHGGGGYGTGAAA